MAQWLPTSKPKPPPAQGEAMSPRRNSVGFALGQKRNIVVAINKGDEEADAASPRSSAESPHLVSPSPAPTSPLPPTPQSQPPQIQISHQGQQDAPATPPSRSAGAGGGGGFVTAHPSTPTRPPSGFFNPAAISAANANAPPGPATPTSASNNNNTNISNSNGNIGNNSNANTNTNANTPGANLNSSNSAANAPARPSSYHKDGTSPSSLLLLHLFLPLLY